jgi:hypothetical protein
VLEKRTDSFSVWWLSTTSVTKLKAIKNKHRLLVTLCIEFLQECYEILISHSKDRVYCVYGQ